MKKFVQFMWECNNTPSKEEGDETLTMRSSVKISESEEGGESPKRVMKKDIRTTTIKSNRKIEQSGADKKR